MPPAFDFLTPPTPLAYFASLVGDDDQLPLLEAAVAIAQDEYPDLDVQNVLGDVDQLLAGKGHEDYQEIAGVKLPFSDLEQGRLALQAWRLRQTKEQA